MATTTNEMTTKISSNSGKPTANIAHEYLGPYRSHAHRQMRSMFWRLDPPASGFGDLNIQFGRLRRYDLLDPSAVTRY